MCVQGLLDAHKHFRVCSVCVQGLLDAHKHFKSTLGDADEEHINILGFEREIERISAEYKLTLPLDNPYTPLDGQVSHVT